MSLKRLIEESRRVLFFIFFPVGMLTAIPTSMAAEKPQYEIPAKNVVVLVDVSGSMSSGKGEPLPQLDEARKVISAIVSGSGLGGLSGDWRPVPLGEDESGSAIQNIRKAFAPYLQNSVASPLPPLVSQGKRLSVRLIGNFNTVIQNTLQKSRDNYEPRQRMVRFAELDSVRNFDQRLQEFWPDSFVDQSTCYTFAVARVAQEMGGGSYYFFTVSDEEDEPSYQPSHKPGVKKDHEMWRMRYASGNWGRSAIDITISEGLKILSGSEQDSLSQIRKTHLIARLQGTNERVKINWYYGGESPREVLKARKPVPKPLEQEPVKTPAAVPVRAPEAPLSSLRFLGTAGTGGKTVRLFDYSNAMVVYQIDHPGEQIPIVNVFMDDEKQELEDLKPEGDAATSRAWGPNVVNTIRLDRLDKDVMKGGFHKLRLEAKGMQPLELEFRVMPRSTAWIGWLGWISAGLALGIFVYSWRSLRHADPAVGV